MTTISSRPSLPPLTLLRASTSRRGQSMVEYVLVVSVLAIAMVAAGYAFLGPFWEGYEGMTEDAGTVLQSGTRDGSNNRR